MEDLLLRNFHDSHCPAFIWIFSVEGLIDCTHSSFSELFCKAVIFVGVIWQKLNFFDKLVKLIIGVKSIIWNLWFFFEASDNLNHDLRVLFDHFFIDTVFAEHLRHLICQPLDTKRTV